MTLATNPGNIIGEKPTWKPILMSEEQIAKIDSKSQDWLDEMENEWFRLEDSQLIAAIAYLSFNFHHGRGYPIIPSVYSDNLPRLRGTF